MAIDCRTVDQIGEPLHTGVLQLQSGKYGTACVTWRVGWGSVKP